MYQLIAPFTCEGYHFYDISDNAAADNWYSKDNLDNKFTVGTFSTMKPFFQKAFL